MISIKKTEKVFGREGTENSEKTDDRLKTAWWPSDDCLMTAWWLPDDCLMTVSDDCLMTAWWLPDDCLMTAWQQPNDKLYEKVIYIEKLNVK